MPIRINLLAEALAEEDLRRRDPVKRAIFIGAFLVALSLVWFSSTWLESMLQKKSLSLIQQEKQSRTNDYVLVQSNLKKIADIQKRLDALQLLSATRFLQGNLLNALQQVYVPNVQLTRIRVDQSYTSQSTKGSAGTATEHMTLMLDAKDFSPNPGDQVNHFKSAVAANDFFKASLEATNGVKVTNISPPQTIGLKPFVILTLECRFPDKIR